MVTQKDISAACGLSVSAVSKALSDYPDISEDTKRRVRDVAEKMGYHGMKSELNRKREHTYTLGLLITEETERSEYQDVIKELRNTLVKKGYDLVLLSPLRKGGGNREKPGYLPRARLYGMEGVFLFTSLQESDLYHHKDGRNLRELILGEIPVVAVGSFWASCSCVLPGYEKGIRGLIREVYMKGHRRIAFVFKERTAVDAQWYKAIRMELEEHYLRVPEYFFLRVEAEADGGSEAFSEIRDLLRGSRWLRPTCILFTDETLLEGGAAAIRQCGFRVPEDICLAAIRISEENKYEDDSVLSWRILPTEIAEAAVEQMFDSMKGSLHGAGRIRVVDGKLYE